MPITTRRRRRRTTKGAMGNLILGFPAKISLKVKGAKPPWHYETLSDVYVNRPFKTALFGTAHAVGKTIGEWLMTNPAITSAIAQTLKTVNITKTGKTRKSKGA